MTPKHLAAVLLLCLGAPALNAESLVFTGHANMRGVSNLPNSAKFLRVGSFRIELQADNFATTAKAGIWELDSSAALYIKDGHILLQGLHGETVALPVSGVRAFRLVAQRDVQGKRYSLELWNQETGEYRRADTPVSNEEAVDLRNRRFSIGSFYETDTPKLRLGFLRWFSTTRRPGGIPPQVEGGPMGDLLNYEFEGNLKDTSGNDVEFSFDGGRPAFATTAAYPPSAVLAGAPVSVRAGETVKLDALSSFPNGASASVHCLWEVTRVPETLTESGAKLAFLENETTCAPTFTPPIFGEYVLRVRVADEQRRSSSRELTIGAVAANADGVVLVPDERIARLLGPLIAFGANPWPWADDRHRRLADFQIAQFDKYWPVYWDTPSPDGTVSAMAGATTITGAGTSFQRDFCGGSGRTTPVFRTTVRVDGVTLRRLSGDAFSPNWTPGTAITVGGAAYTIASMTSEDELTLTAAPPPASEAVVTMDVSRVIYVWYPSTEYPGTTGRARYYVTGCPSDTSVTIFRPYSHPAASGMQYAVVESNRQEGPYLYSPIPANYYDNVLALYSLYYRTGLVKYRDAARELARRFWYGPNHDRGKNHDTEGLGGTWVAAGPARGTAITGLLVWAFDTGENIWPGMHHIWNFYHSIAVDYHERIGWKTQIGDIREMAYLTAGLSLCALHDPDGAWRVKCGDGLHKLVNNLWKPLEVRVTRGSSTWRQVNGTLFNRPDGSVYVTLQNGLREARLTGTTWHTSTFTVSNPLDARVWFLDDMKVTNLAGSSNAPYSSDTKAYKVQSVTDGETLLLAQPYEGCPTPEPCRKGMMVYHLVGFGTMPYMLGMAAGVFGHYTYDAFTTLAATDVGERGAQWMEDRDLVRRFAVEASHWLATTGYDPASQSLWGARGYLNCEPNPADQMWCTPGRALNGEAMRAFTAAYMLTGDSALRDIGDSFYDGLWNKAGTGSKRPSSGTWLQDIEDPPKGYMLSDSSLSNKWLGFYFGYGFAAGWPAARVGGPGDPRLSTVQIPANPGSVPGASRVRFTLLRPSGIKTQADCDAGKCGFNIDTREGRHLLRLDYLDAAGQVVSPGEFKPVIAQP